MSKPIDSRSVSKWTIALDEDRRPWQLVKRREEWANVDTGLRISVGGGEFPTRDVILRATVAWDFDESDAVMNGTKVPGELYKQLDELLRADLVKGIPYELRGLVKPGQTGRELLREVRMSSKSKTREVDRIEKRLTSLVLTNKQDYIRGLISHCWVLFLSCACQVVGPVLSRRHSHFLRTSGCCLVVGSR